MKIFLKILKYLFIISVVIVIITLGTAYLGHKVFFKPKYSEVTTLEPIKNDRFCFGVPCQPKYETADDYIKILAQQIAIYNEKSTELWPNNSVKEYYAVVESIESDKAWLISPKGKIQKLSTA